MPEKKNNYCACGHLIIEEHDKDGRCIHLCHNGFLALCSHDFGIEYRVVDTNEKEVAKD